MRRIKRIITIFITFTFFVTQMSLHTFANSSSVTIMPGMLEKSTIEGDDPYRYTRNTRSSAPGFVGVTYALKDHVIITSEGVNEVLDDLQVEDEITSGQTFNLLPLQKLQGGSLIEEQALLNSVGEATVGDILFNPVTGVAIEIASPADPISDINGEEQGNYVTVRQPEIYDVLKDFNIPQQTVRLTSDHITDYGENILESRVVTAIGTGTRASDALEKYLFDETPLTGYDENGNAVRVSVSGDINLGTFDVSGRYTWFSGYEFAMDFHEHINIEVEVFARMNKEIYIPFFGFDIDAGIGQISGGLFLVVDVNGQVTMAATMAQSFDAHVSVYGDTFLGVTTSIHGDTDFDYSFDVNEHINGAIQGSIKFGPGLNMSLLGYKIFSFGAYVGCEIDASVVGTNINIDVDGMVEIFAIVAGYTVFNKNYTINLYEYQKPNTEGYEIIFYSACAYDDVVWGKIIEDGGGAGFSPYEGELRLKLARPSTGQEALNIFGRSHEDGIFEINIGNTGWDLQKGDEIRLMSLGNPRSADYEIIPGSPVVYPTYPFDKVVVEYADFFNDFSTGYIAPAYRINWHDMSAEEMYYEGSVQYYVHNESGYNYQLAASPTDDRGVFSRSFDFKPTHNVKVKLMDDGFEFGTEWFHPDTDFAVQYVANDFKPYVLNTEEQVSMGVGVMDHIFISNLRGDKTYDGVLDAQTTFYFNYGESVRFLSDDPTAYGADIDFEIRTESLSVEDFDTGASTASRGYVLNLLIPKEAEVQLETTPPTVLTQSPKKGVAGVKVDGDLVLTFDEAIKRGSGSITLVETDGTKAVNRYVINDLEITAFANILTIDLFQTLKKGTEYYIEIEDDAILDYAGNGFIGYHSPQDWYFITETEQPVYVFHDLVAPSISLLSPLNKATKVLTDSELVMTFNETIQRGVGNITLVELGGIKGSDRYIVNKDEIIVAGNTLTIDLKQPLKLDTTYYVLMEKGAVKDLAGNQFNGITTKDVWTFTTTALKFFLFSNGDTDSLMEEVNHGYEVGSRSVVVLPSESLVNPEDVSGQNASVDAKILLPMNDEGRSIYYYDEAPLSKVYERFWAQDEYTDYEVYKLHRITQYACSYEGAVIGTITVYDSVGEGMYTLGESHFQDQFPPGAPITSEPIMEDYWEAGDPFGRYMTGHFIDSETAPPVWAERSAESMLSQGIMIPNALGVFPTGELMTRADVAASLVRAFGIEINFTENTFKDVSALHPNIGEIEAAFGAGIINGNGKGDFNPFGFVTRQEVAAMVSRALDLKGITSNMNVDITQVFSDASLTSGWAIGSVSNVYGLGIMVGSSGAFNPNGQLTFDEMAVMIDRIMDMN